MKPQQIVQIVLAVLGAVCGGWGASKANDAASATNPASARVEALAAEVEWLKWHVRRGGCGGGSEEEAVGPPANLAPLPRAD